MSFGGVSRTSSKQCSFLTDSVSPWFATTDYLNLKFKFDGTNIRVSAQRCTSYDEVLRMTLSG